MQSKSGKLDQTSILNFVESHISFQNCFCRIAIFGEDILNRGRELPVLHAEDFQHGGFELEL